MFVCFSQLRELIQMTRHVLFFTRLNFLLPLCYQPMYLRPVKHVNAWIDRSSSIGQPRLQHSDVIMMVGQMTVRDLLLSSDTDSPPPLNLQTFREFAAHEFDSENTDCWLALKNAFDKLTASSCHPTRITCYSYNQSYCICHFHSGLASYPCTSGVISHSTVTAVRHQPFL